MLLWFLTITLCDDENIFKYSLSQCFLHIVNFSWKAVLSSFTVRALPSAWGCQKYQERNWQASDQQVCQAIPFDDKAHQCGGCVRNQASTTHWMFVRWREHVPASSAVGTDHSVLCRVSSAAASPLDLGRGESLEWMRVYSFELAWTELFLYLKMNLIQLLPVIEDPLNLLELYSKSKNENLTKHACLNTEIREK